MTTENDTVHEVGVVVREGVGVRHNVLRYKQSEVLYAGGTAGERRSWFAASRKAAYYIIRQKQ